MSLAANQKNNTAGMPPAIGRFMPLSILGRGAQGVVYLARDPDLDRDVAIKTITCRQHDHTQLLNEARNVAKLQHPNIVPLYEIGTHEGAPFLVYQFAEGDPLKRLLGTGQPVAPARAIPLIATILDAIGSAHKVGIIHRDLSPTNILLDSAEQPHVLDFGVSGLVGLSTNGSDIVGTVNYMAPEALSGGDIGPATDLFSVGVILYEMLTGEPLFAANNHMAVMYKIVHERVLPPSTFNKQLDKALDGLVMRALDKDPAKRYDDAGEMQVALQKFLEPDEPEPRDLSGDGTSGALEFLMRKIRRKPDFPAISQHISDISQKTSASFDTHNNDLANIILKDYAITSKLLRLVNSAVYRQCGGGAITTVSRAVMILGYERVRQAALNIALFEHLKDAQQAEGMKNALMNSFMSAVIAKEMAAKLPRVNAEEAFIVSLFLRLGKLLTIYYFPEEYSEIEQEVSNKGGRELTVSKAVLGVSYVEIGMAIAKEWKLPDLVVKGMRASESPGQDPGTVEVYLLQLASFSNEIAETVSKAAPDSQRELGALVNRYKRSLKLNDSEINNVVKDSFGKMEEYADILSLNVKTCPAYAAVKQRVAADERGVDADVDATGTATGTPTGGGVTTDGGAASATAPPPTSEPSNDRRMLLINSIAEITTTLLGEFDLNNILVMILETLYRGIGFSRVVMLVRDARNRQMVARFGFGQDIDQMIPTFRYPLSAESDIFNDAVRHSREYVVLDVDAAEYQGRVPDWCRQLLKPRAVVLLPIVLNKACISLIYADSTESGARISAEELKLFATLTKQAALAIHQKSAKK